MLAERIREWPERFKQEGREKGLEEGLEAGREEGREEVREENARTMLLETSMDDAMVAKLSGLDEARVAELRREIER